MLIVPPQELHNHNVSCLGILNLEHLDFMVSVSLTYFPVEKKKERKRFPKFVSLAKKNDNLLWLESEVKKMEGREREMERERKAGVRGERIKGEDDFLSTKQQGQI